MNIQETIKHLQSSIKKRANDIAWWEEQKKYTKESVKKWGNTATGRIHWHYYHQLKDAINSASKQQKIEKSLYKLMLNIAKNSPNGSISLYQIGVEEWEVV